MNRREFASGLTLAGMAAAWGWPPEPADAEPPPETKRLNMARTQSICQAPQYVAKGLLEAEGFTDVQYIRGTGGGVDAKGLASGELQITLTFAGPLIARLDEGDPVVLLGGVHIGCIELFGHDRIRTVRDLKGTAVAVPAMDGPQHVFLAILMAHVGLDHRKDIKLVARPVAEAARLFEERKVDAFVAAPPVAQELRAKKVGHVVVNSTTDRPWSQYFCCMIAGNREFVRKQGFANRYDHALQVMKEIPYRQWRDYDPEDTIRFYALLLHEAGMIKSSPQKIIAQSTEWRFLNELRKELKS